MIDFIPQLFGLHKGDQFEPFGDTDCGPKKRSDTQKWHWASSLGQCGMELFTTKSLITFQVKISTEPNYPRGSRAPSGMRTRPRPGVDLIFRCDYSAYVKVDLVQPESRSVADYTNTFHGHGSLADGFNLDIMSHGLSGGNIIIGINWFVRSELVFYIHRCRLSVKARDIVRICGPLTSKLHFCPIFRIYK